MLTFKQFLLIEAKTNPLNKKIGTIQQIQQLIIKNKLNPTDVYVTYSDSPNVHKHMILRTFSPNGIYTYSLQHILDRKFIPPFAGLRKYMILFKIAQSAKVWNLGDNTNITEIKNKAIQVVQKLYNYNLDLTNISSCSKLYIALLKYTLSGDEHMQSIPLHGGDAKSGRIFRTILLSMGFNVVIDPGLYAIDPIQYGDSTDESEQAVFLTPNAVELLDVIQNQQISSLSGGLADIKNLSAQEIYFMIMKGFRNAIDQNKLSDIIEYVAAQPPKWLANLLEQLPDMATENIDDWSAVYATKFHDIDDWWEQSSFNYYDE